MAEITLSGLSNKELVIEDSAIRELVRRYTREAGVRNLEREMSKICRKVVKEAVLGQTKSTSSVIVTAENLEQYCGVYKFSYGKAEEKDQIGQVTGLAWTSVGGELLTIEAVSTMGKGRFTMTGKLGEVMQESIKAAITVVRARSQTLGLAPEFHEQQDLHIHIPEGATPKDGPSAGIGMCTAIVSVLTGIPVRADVAMTGEITLRGQVLPIGGLKEKLLAAHRGGIKTVIIPEENARDLKEIPDNIKADLTIKTVKWIDEVLAIALTRQPTPLADALPTAILSKSDEGDDSERMSTH